MEQQALIRVVIVGSGNLAESLAVAVAASGATLVQLFARNAARGKEVAERAGTVWCADPAALAAADIYLIAVSDRVIGEVAGALPIPAGAVVAHTAGSVAMEVLPARFRRAVFYPMQTFTAGRAVDFGAIPLFLECEDPSLRPALESLARSLSGQVFWATSEQRRRLHLAAVFACNFANHMYTLSERVLAEAGLGFDLMKPLLLETARKAASSVSPAAVQTGPARRGDRQTQRRHLGMLAASPDLQAIYETMSQHIWETSKKI